jgi:hypothetical protein
VKGALTPALTVENVHSVYHGTVNPLNGRLDVTYTVRNAGNVRLAAHQSAEGAALLGLGKKTVKLKDIPELLPNNAITLHASFKHVPAAFLANDKILLQPFSSASDLKDLRPVHRTGRTLAIPWSVIVLLVLTWAGRRLRRSLRDRRRPPAGPSTPSPEERLVRVP